MPRQTSFRRTHSGTPPPPRLGRRERHKTDVRNRLMRAAFELFGARGFPGHHGRGHHPSRRRRQGNIFQLFPHQGMAADANGRTPARYSSRGAGRSPAQIASRVRDLLRDLLLTLVEEPRQQPWNGSLHAAGAAQRRADRERGGDDHRARATRSSRDDGAGTAPGRDSTGLVFGGAGLIVSAGLLRRSVSLGSATESKIVPLPGTDIRSVLGRGEGARSPKQRSSKKEAIMKSFRRRAGISHSCCG